MEIIALILAAVAVLVFLLAHFGAATKWASVPLGLALLSAAITIWHTVGQLEPVFNKGGH